MAHDATLKERLQKGERKAFEELLDAYGPRVQKLAQRYAATPADAEDLVQEIFVDLFRCAGSFRGEADLGTWVYRVALNHCLRWKEKQSREGENRDFEKSSDELEVPSQDKSSDPARRQGQRELSGQVHDALRDLSDLHRDVVVLHELHGLTYTQCAAILEVPVGTVKSRLSNAFSHLRRTLGPYVLQSEANGEATTPQAGGAL
jgi:RNA polymerase sigma-70 factor (ECF subfamily)